MDSKAVVLLVLAAALLPPLDGARILGVLHSTGRSHFMVFEPLLKALAARGHELVVASHFPQQAPPPGWTDVNLAGTVPNDNGKLDLEQRVGIHPIVESVVGYWFLAAHQHGKCEPMYSSPAMQDLIHNDTRGFDLIINEAFGTNCFLGLVHRFRPAPYIAMSSCPPFGWEYHRVGSPHNHAVMPHTFLWLSDQMSLLERIVNTVFSVGTRLWDLYVWDRAAQRVAEKYIGPGLPPITDIAYNVSLILSNTQPALSLPKPLTPGVIEIGGIHIGKPKPMPQDLERFVSEAKDGVVVFSLGSMIRASSLPQASAAGLLRALGTLRQRVVWKWEDQAPGPVPDNVLISKWLPQFDVICHNNTRLFIGHGGLLSTTEAAYCGVPMAGFAMFGDQYNNLAAISRRGAGRSLPYSTLKDADLFLKHVKELLDDTSYRDNAKLLSSSFRDLPQSPLETAVFWTEYVIRHKGAPHLIGSSRSLMWFQEAQFDVFAVLVLTFVAILAAVWLFVRSLWRRTSRLIRASPKEKLS